MAGGGKAYGQDIAFVGDYNLETLILINSVGEPLKLAMGTVVELNVYEDINANAVTGSIHIIDSHNIISNASLQGNERLVFKLSTPGVKGVRVDTVDATEETGYPFHIYALTDRKNTSEGVMTYVLHFCSKELLRNVRTRVSKAYNGGLAQSVVNILRDEDGLNSRKDIYYEETRNSDKIVIPNMRPFNAINLMSRKALSKNAKGSGYHFYETTKGFHFRSYESMLAYQSLHHREEILTLSYEPKLIDTPSYRKYLNQHNIDSYEFVQHFDTLAQQAMGTYASRIITHNMYDKSYNIEDYHYHDQFADMFHADQVSSRSKRNFAISDTPVDHDPKGYAPGDKTVSDYPDSQVVLQGSTRFLHGENTGIFGTDPDSEGLTEAIRMSQENQVTNSMRVKIVVPGHSYLQAGDLIRFKLPSLEPNKGEGKTQLDEFHSGRYIVSKLRHRVVLGEYKMILECVKDSVVRNYINLPNENFKGKEPPQGGTKDIYKQDEFNIHQRMGHHR
jgi:hypothetical protein